MIEEKCNIWTKWEAGEWVCITTNNFVKRNGEAVMGRGVARQAAFRFPGLARELGERILVRGCTGNGKHSLDEASVKVFTSKRLVAFPVKFAWWEEADIGLIKHSAIQLVEEVLPAIEVDRIYLPRPGCGNGKLKWAGVKKELDGILDERVIVVTV